MDGLSRLDEEAVAPPPWPPPPHLKTSAFRTQAIERLRRGVASPAGLFFFRKNAVFPSNSESNRALRALHDVRLTGLLHARFKTDIPTSGEPTSDIISHGLTAAPSPRINYAVDGDLDLFTFGILAAFGTLSGTSFRDIGSSDQRLFAAALALRASHCCRLDDLPEQSATLAEFA
ncbi:hypothetical protein BDZ89DRAFT_1137735 [Hymenopellis radicata]|nr:hypothetical protein BDZ89DRAFT_1137735 [Hymenopellis radicata]